MKFKKLNVVKLISVICAILFFALVIILIVEFINIANLNNKEKALQKRLSDVEQSIVNVTNQNNYLNSSEYLEDYAREVLGWGDRKSTRLNSSHL